MEQELLQNFPEAVDEEVLQLQTRFRNQLASLNQETQEKTTQVEQQIREFQFSAEERQMVHWIDLFQFVGSKIQNTQNFIRKKLNVRSKCRTNWRIPGRSGRIEEFLRNGGQVPSSNKFVV